VGSEDLLRDSLGNTVWQREAEILLQYLFDIWSANVGSLLDFNDLENLQIAISLALMQHVREELTWIDRKRARCRAAKSWYKA